MAEHAPKGGSTCVRWYNCAASFNLTRGVKTPVTKYMAQGTVAHSVAERILNGMIADKDPAMYRPIEGSLVECDGFKIEVDRAMINFGLDYAEFVLELAEKNNIPKHSIAVEKKVKISDDMFGTADICMYASFGTLFVIDYKYGAGNPVTAFENKQGLYYATGAYLSLPHSVRACLTDVTIIIVQPRCVGAGTTYYTISVEELEDFHNSLLEASEAADQENAPLSAGPWCDKGYCPMRKLGTNGKPLCRAYQAMVEDETNIDFDEAIASGNMKKQLPVLADVTPEDMENFLLKGVPLLKTFIKEAEKLAYKMGKQNLLPNMKVVKTFGNRAWVDTDKVIEEYKPFLGENVYEPPKKHTKKVRSPAQLTNAIKEYNREAKKGGKEKLEIKNLEKFYHKPENGEIIVELDDKRPAVVVDAKKDFDGELPSKI